MIDCKGCKSTKGIPMFPIWDNKAKYWSNAKKLEKLKELCCELNDNSTQRQKIQACKQERQESRHVRDKGGSGKKRTSSGVFS